MTPATIATVAPTKPVTGVTVVPEVTPVKLFCDTVPPAPDGSPTTGEAGYIYGADVDDVTPMLTHAEPEYENTKLSHVVFADQIIVHAEQPVTLAVCSPEDALRHTVAPGSLMYPDAHGLQMTPRPPGENVLAGHCVHEVPSAASCIPGSHPADAAYRRARAQSPETLLCALAQQHTWSK